VWLLIGYAVYLIYVFNRDKGSEGHESPFQAGNWVRKTILLLFSIVLMLVSAQVLVKSSIGLSELVHIPAIFIGLTLTAVGTSIPELVFGLKVIKTKLKSEIMGSVLGSVVVNSTLVVGATAIITPIKREAAEGNTSILFLALSLILFITISLTGRRISRFEAILLTMFYLFFLFMEKRIAGI
jgi:cation:H+ antiporter